MSDDLTGLPPDRSGAPAFREHDALDLSGRRTACLACGARLFDDSLYVRLRVCPRCRFHYHMTARERVAALTDENSFEETSAEIQSLDPLEFTARLPYRARVLQDQSRTGLQEAAMTGLCTIGGLPVVIIVLDFGFLGGSMGLVVGEKVALALELAEKKGLPVIAVITSGGARIQEGVLSLMQMAKTVLAASALHDEGLPLISVLGNPATGQVLASFGSLADIIIAEPGAHIGFAPYRSLRDAHVERVPDAEYSAENFYQHGQVDRIVDRENLKDELAAVLDLLSTEFRQEKTKKTHVPRPRVSPREPWEMVELARRSDRPRASDYISRVFADFIELHGDRLYGDDPSVIVGIGRLGAESVVVIGQEKARAPVEPSSGAPMSVVIGPAEARGEITPEGFRKASRAMDLASRFKLPVISLVDTPGPLLGLDMERRGLAGAISGMIKALLHVKSPTVSVLIGEGGSEAALAFGVADRVLMLQNAIYTPISPEGGAEAEHRDIKRSKDMARSLRLTSTDCLEMGVIDAVVPEPQMGAHASPDEAARLLRRMLMRELIDLEDHSGSRLSRRRRNKYRNMGEYGKGSGNEAQKELRTWRSALVRGLRRRPRSHGGEVQAPDLPPPDDAAVEKTVRPPAAKPPATDSTRHGDTVAVGQAEQKAPATKAVASPSLGATAAEPAVEPAPVAKPDEQTKPRRRRISRLLLRRRSKPPAT